MSVTQTQFQDMITDLHGTDETNFRIKDGAIQLKNVVDGLYHTLWIDGQTLKFAQTGEA